MELLDGFKESFIGCLVSDNPEYGFLPHFQYFFDNRHRWRNSNKILKRILARVPENPDEAWEVWRQFRSAQAEISSIFLLENVLKADVLGLEVSKEGVAKSCDICATFSSCGKLYIEVKAQSGQQHGDRHPLSRSILFSPRNEEDLRSWLFEEKVSSKDGKVMKPYCFQASEKSADVLMVITDIFSSGDMLSLGKVLSPDQVSAKRESMSGDSKHKLFVVEAGKGTSGKMYGLNEVWLFDNSRLDEMLVLHTKGTILQRN